MKIFIKKPFLPILIIGIIVRLLLLPTTFHPDLLGHLFTGSFFSQQGIFNIYNHLANLPVTHPLAQNFGVADIFIYPPLAYFTFGSFQKLLYPLINWQFVQSLMEGLSVYQPELPWLLFIIKLPYLFLDIFLGFTLTKLFKNIKQKKLIFILWMLNPVTLYATATMGVFDIIPTLTTTLAVVALKEKKLNKSALLLGLGAAFKSYPLFLLPFVVLGNQRNWFKKIKLTLIGLSPYILSFIPFWSSPAFRHMVFSPKSQKMLFMSLPVSGAEGLFPFVIGTVLLYLLAFKNKNLFTRFYQYFLAFFLLLFSVTHYHPQWFLWISPFLIIELVTDRFKNLYLVLGLFACFIFIVLMFDPSLNVGLFTPVNSNLATLPGLANFLATKTDINLLKSFVRSISAALSLFFTYELLKKK